MNLFAQILRKKILSILKNNPKKQLMYLKKKKIRATCYKYLSLGDI